MPTTVPSLKTYTSKDGNFSIKIKTSNGSTGQVTCDYVAKTSPEGQINDTQSIGGFGWVHNDALRRNDVAPFPIQVSGSKRGDQFSYAIVDSWNGAYQPNDTLLMTGSRSYVNSKGLIKVEDLGSQTFA